MREIKFRVFDSRTNQMSRDFVFINFITKTMGFYAINSLGEKKIFERDMDNFPIMQYTGLKDKNDVEIYESDIIKAIWSKDCDEYIANEEWIGDIFFNYGSFDINGEWCVSLNCFNGTLEVIGNIYENPELLESK